ncbi:ATP-binding protein [Brevundimonas staleyi]|uniref:histidine kinase n=1 Tax=Brevundimonas staleyi TaxID=74326 RepID=A0ABW0G0N0_9CAUL
MGRRTWKTFRVAVLFVVLAAAGVLTVLAVVGSAIDAHQREKEQTLVELRLARALKSVGEDLTANTIWDEAVVRLSGPRDLDWIDHHVAPFFVAQSGHEATVVYDGPGRLLRVSLNGEATGDDPAEPHAAALSPLVADARARSVGRDRAAVAMAAVRVSTGVVQVADRTFLAAASTVVRHTDDGPIRDADPIVASMKPFETMIAPLGPELGLTHASYQSGVEPRLGSHQAAVAVPGLDDQTLGWIVWTPEAPGAAILRQAVPLMLALLAATLLAATILFRRVAEDVRELGESEQALAVALRKAEAASDAKSRFLSNISHELRTPLNGVLGMAEIIEGDLLTPQQKDRMVVLKEAGKAQLRLIENLLTAMRLQNEAVTLTPAAFVPDKLLKRVVGDYRATAIAKGLKLKVEAQTPTARLGDEDQIARLIEPILDNAIRFTASGTVTVRSRETARRLVVEVLDTGPGMDPGTAQTLFTAFTQGDETSTRATDGAGLGLAISHGLATLMNGRIEVESKPGEGSLFRVTLPLSAAG